MKRSGLCAGAIALCVGLPAVAVAQEAALPQAKSYGSLTYLSGGIGQDEALAMKQAQKQYPLSMVFSEGQRGEYLSGVGVTIRDRVGSTILQTVSDGPIMLVKLPAGEYRVDAEANGKTLHREARIAASGGTHLSFNWPQS